MIQNQTHRNRAIGAALLAIGALTAQASTDYGPAIWRAASSGNYYTSGNGHKFLVIHDMEGFYGSVYSVLEGQGLSVHYGVNSGSGTSASVGGHTYTDSDGKPAGEITQMVRDANYAIHARCWNTHSAGTEHEGFAGNPAWFTEAQYQASAGLQRHLTDTYNITRDRNHIVGHNAKSSSAWVTYANANLGIDPTCNTHSDPGAYWDWTHFMDLIVNATPPPMTLPPHPDFTGFVGKLPNGQMQMFIRQTNNTLKTTWRQTDNTWVAWQSFAGNCVGDVSMAMVGGQMQLFTRGTSNTAQTRWRQSDNTWVNWQDFAGSCYADVTVGYVGTQPQIFTRGVGGTVQTRWRQSDNTWVGWQDFAGNGVGTVAVGYLPNNQMQVFSRTTNNTVQTRYRQTDNTWTGWSDFAGTSAGDITIGYAGTGQMQLFMKGPSGTVQTRWRQSDNTWVNWQDFAGSCNGLVTVGYLPDGRMQLFMRTSANTVQTRWKNVDETWVGWQDFAGTCYGPIGIGYLPNNQMQIFTTSATGVVQTRYRMPDNSWSNWAAMP